MPPTSLVTIQWKKERRLIDMFKKPVKQANSNALGGKELKKVYCHMCECN